MSGSLFEEDKPGGPPADAPLADRMRPQTLDEIVGQTHLLDPGKPLRTAIERDQVPSMILWGPPGVGKTTLAQVIAKLTKSTFIPFSAVLSGIKEIKDIMAAAEKARRLGKRTIIFVDEIHRFNKAQQDAFLPYVENGTITLIGATTENPSFEVISALLSRTRVFVLNQLTRDELEEVVVRALKDKQNGFGNLKIKLSSDALDFLLEGSNGDARIIEAWEDPLSIARRMVIFASEDIGMALPTALVVANQVFEACEKIGLPECQINLAHGVTYLCLAKKDRSSYEAYFEALEDVKK